MWGRRGRGGVSVNVTLDLASAARLTFTALTAVNVTLAPWTGASVTLTRPQLRLALRNADSSANYRPLIAWTMFTLSSMPLAMASMHPC